MSDSRDGSDSREATRAAFLEESSRKREQGLFPYDGRWRSLEEIRALHDELRRKDRSILVELILLFAAMAASSALLWLVLLYLL